MIRNRTQVCHRRPPAPAGLVLSHLLHLRGNRVRNPRIAQPGRDRVDTARPVCWNRGTVDLLTRCGVGERLAREGFVHHGIELRFDGQRHRIPLSELTGGARPSPSMRSTKSSRTSSRAASSTPVGRSSSRRETSASTITVSTRPRIRYSGTQGDRELTCDFIAGCDGFPRRMPGERARTSANRIWHAHYPFGWFRYPGQGRALRTRIDLRPPRARVLAGEHAVSRGATTVFPMRSQRRHCALARRPYLGVSCRLVCRRRRAGRWKGRISSRKGIIAMRSFVLEPMQFGRLFPRGRRRAHCSADGRPKGLNLAVADVYVLANALAEFYGSGRSEAL